MQYRRMSKIIQLVKEHEDRGGITKNEACRILIENYGGSRSTYWKCFDYLMGPILAMKLKQRLFPQTTTRETLSHREE